jgi:hypothetical protein
VANTALTVKLVDGSTVTYTMGADDKPTAKQFAMSVAKNGGFFDDAGAFHPISAVVTVAIA